jgi:hypothetical protein
MTGRDEDLADAVAFSFVPLVPVIFHVAKPPPSGYQPGRGLLTMLNRSMYVRAVNKGFCL